MIQYDLLIRFNEMETAGDLAGIDRLLTAHPEMVADREMAGPLMQRSVSKPDLIVLLLRHGVDVNVPLDRAAPDPTITFAAHCGYTETVRLLLSRGSLVNYCWGDHPAYCIPLASAVRAGNLEMVRLFVEAGAYLNVIDRVNSTPLTWALNYGRDEVAAYLRSKGAKEAHEVPGYVPPPPPDPVPDSVAANVGLLRPNSWLPIVPDDANPIPVRAADCGDGIECLFTSGMSSRPQPPGPGDGYDHAELACFLAGWPYDAADWTDAHLWPVHWLRRLAAYPWQAGVGYGGPVAVVANGDPPTPLGPGTALTCWLLLTDKAPLERAYLADGTEVVFYTAVPIHTAERDYERTHGAEALLEKFAEAGVPDYIDPARPSVV